MPIECLAWSLEQTKYSANLAPTASYKQNAVRKSNVSLMAETKFCFSSSPKCQTHSKFSVYLSSQLIIE